MDLNTNPDPHTNNIPNPIVDTILQTLQNI